MRRNTLVVVAACSLLSVFCQQKGSSDSDVPVSETVAEQLARPLDLDKAVVETPGPLVSVTAPVDIRFNEAVVPPHLSGVTLDKSPFAFEPRLDGAAQWLSQSHIRFMPDKPLEAGTKYTATFKGKVAFGDQRDVDDFEFTFKTAEQEVVGFSGDFKPDNSGENMVRFNGSISFAQPVSVSTIAKHLSCRVENHNVRLKLNATSDSPVRLDITSEPLKRKRTGRTLTFTLPKRYTVSGDKWTQQVLLPEAYVFKILAHMDMTDPKSARKTYGFRFSDPVKQNMDLSGFVTVTPRTAHTVSVSGKYLKVSGNFEAGKEYRFVIAAGLPSALGTSLASSYVAKPKFTNIKPVVEWLSRGVYLPSSNVYKLQFKSVNVAKARITVTEIYENNLGFFVQTNALRQANTGSNGPYGYYGGSSKSYSDLNRVGKQIYSDTLELSTQRNTWERTELDLGPVFNGKRNTAFVVNLTYSSNDLCGRCINDRNDLKPGDLYYEEANYYSDPCERGYYYRHGNLQKLLIASNIALTLKQASDGLHLFAVDVVKGAPAAGLPVGLYSYQNQLLQRLTTNNSGHTLFTAENGYYVRGEDASGLAIMRLDETAWDLSGIDVSGVSAAPSGVNTFIYTERGVHRPGDTVHLAAVIRADREAPPAEQPVHLKVRNPQGQLVHEASRQCGPNGHVAFAIPTGMSDPTGRWEARIEVASETFTHPLKIETVKPNRLKVEIDVPDTMAPENKRLVGKLRSRYLFGTPAAGLRAQLKVTLSPRSLLIPTYREYTFTTPMRTYRERRDEIEDASLNDDGVLTFVYDVKGARKAPGLVSALLAAEVFEKGGGSTRQYKRVTVVPHRAFVGVKNVFSWNGARVGETYKLPVVATDIHGKALAGRDLSVKVYLNRRYWWYDHNRNERPDFRSMKNTYTILEKDLISDDRPVTLDLEIEDYGQHLLEITDKESGHSTGLFFWASSWGRDAPGEEQDRPLLSISSDKNLYNTGDRATLSFPTPTRGVALVTIEQGARILHRVVKPITEERTSVSFEITDEYLPNCYAVVSVIQPHGGRDNDAPLRIYGVKPMVVEDLSTRLRLSMSAPEEIKPNERFEVRLSSQSRRPATATIAVVDEGLLDLTGFETPDIWGHFFQRLRLGIVTRDNCDQILGMLLPDMDRFFSIGGDMAAERRQRAGESRVQRFKPTVLYRAPVTIPAGTSITVPFTMPNYVGSVRIMVVGAAQHSYASLEKTVPVRQPLMVLPTVPRVARPGDRFDVPVSVFATDASVRDANVSLSVSDNLQIEGTAEQRVTFSKPGEQDVAFSVRVKEQVGEGVLIVRARSGKHRAEDTTHLPLNSPNPYYTRVTDTTVSKGSQLVITPRKVGLEGTNAANLSFTRMPDIQLKKRLNYLIRYPYGCIEQTVSSAFPQLFLGNLLDLKSREKQEITNNINGAIDRLARFRMSGGFSYWPLNNYRSSKVSDWGTNYAGHFLTEAKTAGFHVPEGLYKHLIRTTRGRAKNVNRENHRYQAYRLYLLSLAGEPHRGAMNLMRENYLAELDPLSKKLLAAAFYLTGQKDAGRAIDKKTSTEITSYREMSGTFGSGLRDRAMIAYLAFKMDDQATASRVMRGIARDFRGGRWFSTQETAMALLAVTTIYARSTLGGGAIRFTVRPKGKKTRKLEVEGYQVMFDASDLFDTEITITSESTDPLFVTLLEEGIPLESQIETGSNGMELTRNFYNDNGQSITQESIRQGTPFWVRYRVRSTTRERLKELALSSLFPSGWEVINLRLEGLEPPSWVKNYTGAPATYMDIRDDRVNWFFDLDYKGEANFLVKISPTFKGTYRLPPVVVEPMYSPVFYARIAGDTVSVR